MLWGMVVRVVVMFLLGRLLFRRVLAVGFWILVVVAIYLLAASQVHAQEDLDAVWFAPLAPAVEGQPGTAPRGVVLSTERTVQIPVRFPPEAKLRVAASPDGIEPIQVDDILRARFSTRDGETFFRFEHDFQRPGGRGIEPYGPLDVTGLLPLGEVIVSIEVTDMQPPLFGNTPLYLVMLVSRGLVAERDTNANLTDNSTPTALGGGIDHEDLTLPIAALASPPIDDHPPVPISTATTATPVSVPPIPLLIALFLLLLAGGLAARALASRAFWWAAARRVGQ